MTIQTIPTQRCRRKLHWEHEHVNISDGLMAGSVTVEEAQLFGSVAVLLFAQDAAPHPLCTKRTRLWMLAPSLYGPHFNVFLSLSLTFSSISSFVLSLAAALKCRPTVLGKLRKTLLFIPFPCIADSHKSSIENKYIKSITISLYTHFNI